MMRIEVLAVADTLGKVVATFEAAHRGWQRAIARQARIERQVEQTSFHATGGLEMPRFERASRNRRIHTTADARGLAKVIRAQGAVRTAQEEAERLRALEAVSLCAARDRLADAAKHLLRFGQLAVDRTGLCESEVRLLARRPTRPRQSR
jgi:hypothetical protein